MDLSLDRLSCRRAGRLIFEDLSFRLPAGCVAALRGPNGVGKSTLLRVLAGFLPAEHGDAKLGSHSLIADKTGFQEYVAYAGHLDAVKPALAVAENLEIWARLYGAAPKEIPLALDQFGLADIATRPVAQCSAGQKRRLGLVRLKVTKRPLWLMDEPTVSLDSDAIAMTSQMISEHVAGGGSALIATHSDLRLGEIPELHLKPLTEHSEAGQDPFLVGDWA